MKNRHTTPSYLYVLTGVALLIAAFAAAIGLKIVQIGHFGIIINL